MPAACGRTIASVPHRGDPHASHAVAPASMNAIIYLIGLAVVLYFVLSLLGLL